MSLAELQAFFTWTKPQADSPGLCGAFLAVPGLETAIIMAAEAEAGHGS